MDGLAAGDCTVSPTARRGTYDRKIAGRDSAHLRRGVTSSSRGAHSDAMSRHATPPALEGAATASAMPTLGRSLLLHDHRILDDLDPDRIQRTSLASMFEAFLLQNDQGNDDAAAAQLGMILFGESSPLTFALKAPNSGQPTNLHDAASDLRRSKRQTEHAQEKHPSHCSVEDIAYLEAKHAFTAPDAELQGVLLAAFFDHFYPLYSIVNRADILQMHSAGTIPWILLHAICFIGATFCNVASIHRSSFHSRLHARRIFYEKAKVLFDVGYEMDKLTLLQTSIMMSFWGPQIKSYWNPCSWIGFAVTIAMSLGIHRSTSSVQASVKDKRLVKRLWWSLAVRDACCATLLGRPFRIDISQCDTDMLEVSDFDEDYGRGQDYAMYQVQIARLSDIVRRTTQGRVAAENCQDLYDALDQWYLNIPSSISPSLNRDINNNNNNIFASALQIMYHCHKILIHLIGSEENNVASYPPSHSRSTDMAVRSAQTISSTVSTFVTKQLTTRLPHELFTGFFLAGIVLYRQSRLSDGHTSQMARASLDNCQLLLNEVREAWDPAHWVMRIIDFLLSNCDAGGDDGNAATSNSPLPQDFALDVLGGSKPHGERDAMDGDSNYLYSVDWNSPETAFVGSYNDFLLMSNCFVPKL